MFLTFNILNKKKIYGGAFGKENSYKLYQIFSFFLPRKNHNAAHFKEFTYKKEETILKDFNF